MSIDWGEVITWSNASDIVDILLVWYLVYKLIMILKGTRSIQLLNRDYCADQTGCGHASVADYRLDHESRHPVGCRGGHCRFSAGNPKRIGAFGKDWIQKESQTFNQYENVW